MENFNNKYVIASAGYATPCWLWTASKDKDGYGWFAINRKSLGAHRASWFLKHGSLPPYPEFELDHLCSNRDCVNPDHLEVVSHRENSLRGKSFSADNSKKSSCVNGHEYTKENTYIRPDGCRDCRACIRDRVRAYTARRRAA